MEFNPLDYEGAFLPILGDPGSGKTALMTYMGKYVQNRGYPVVSNYPVKYPHTLVTFEQIRTLLDPANIKFRESLRGAYLLMDEMHEGGDAYDFASKWTRALSRVVAQRRHLDFTILATYQHGSQVVRRNRISGDFWFVLIDMDKRERIDLRPYPDRPHRPFYNCAGISRVEVLDEKFDIESEFVFESQHVWADYDSRYIISDTRPEDGEENDKPKRKSSGKRDDNHTVKLTSVF